jgi:hypothetical protein
LRNQNLKKQRQLRKEVNRLNRKPLTADEVNCMLDPNQIISAPFLNLCLKSWIELHYMV